MPAARIKTPSTSASPTSTEAQPQSILIVDPDTDFAAWASRHLAAPSIETLTSNNTEEGFRIFRDRRPDVVISELKVMPDSGMEFLRRIREVDPKAMVLLTTGFPPSSAVIEAMRLGAYEFLRKESLPFELRPVVEGALRARDEMRAAAQEPPPGRDDTAQLFQEDFIGTSPSMQEVYKLIGRVSRSDATVMITGENGCGKERVARAIHKFSPRAKREFVAINCAAIPDNLLESELFGHEKGAFTGATAQRIGRFEQCDGGTLFLDEIGDMPMPVQSKILRVLQEGEFSRLGGNTTLKADVRILAATNKVLEREVEAGRFREDLFYRLNVIRIHLPPLRQRREDIRLLAEFFLKAAARRSGGRPLRLSEEAVGELENYDWPGNVRELENAIQRACVLATTEVILPRDIPLGSAPRTAAKLAGPAEAKPGGGSGASVAEVPLDAALEVLFRAAEKDKSLQLLPFVERELTQYAMDKTGWNQVRAAKMLGITRATLRKRLERFDLERAPAGGGEDGEQLGEWHSGEVRSPQ
ncbi:MAG: sigma-54 dependent transcriptional regulator [Verrucomicrobiales bacterium]